MVRQRVLPMVWPALACLLAACGERSASEAAAVVRGDVAASATRREPTAGDSEPAGDPDLLLLGIRSPDAELELRSELMRSPAGTVPDPGTQGPVEGPRGGALFLLGEDQGYYELAHNEHWGTAALYLYDARMAPRSFDAPPVLNVRCDGESLALEPSRESFEEVVDGGWHFEDDALLGVPESGRFRLVVDGRTWTPLFEHVHVGHGHTEEHAMGPHVHGAGPRGGRVLTLGAHRAHVEVVHRAHWGILGLYVYDAAMEPRTLDETPVLNLVCDEEPIQLVAGREDWEGETDGGWHFEDDALLGETGPGRFRLVLDGRTYAPPFVYHAHGEEAGHSHDQGGS